MSSLLKTVFLDNPDIPEAVHQYCLGIREYGQMLQVLRERMEELRAAMGQEWYDRFEDELNRVWSMENWAHYLIGLQLRRDLLEALGEEL